MLDGQRDDGWPITYRDIREVAYMKFGSRSDNARPVGSRTSLPEGHRASQLRAMPTTTEQPFHEMPIENDTLNGNAMLMSEY